MATDGLVVEYSHTVTWTESDPEYFTPDILYEPAKDFKNIHPITWIDSEYERNQHRCPKHRKHMLDTKWQQ